MHAVLDFGHVIVTPLPGALLAAYLTGRGRPERIREAMRELAIVAEWVEELRAMSLAPIYIIPERRES